MPVSNAARLGLHQPERNDTPRQVRKMSRRMERFVAYYCHSLDPGAAYTEAYGVTNKESAASCGHRLLKSVAVLAAVEKFQLQMMDKLGWNATEVVQRFHALALKATEAGDYGAALHALDKIA